MTMKIKMAVMAIALIAVLLMAGCTSEQTYPPEPNRDGSYGGKAFGGSCLLVIKGDTAEVTPTLNGFIGYPTEKSFTSNHNGTYTLGTTLVKFTEGTPNVMVGMDGLNGEITLVNQGKMEF